MPEQQSISQQVLDRILRNGSIESYVGADILYKNLNAEATRMIDRLRYQEQNATTYGKMAVAEDERLTLQKAFEELGLITPKDEDSIVRHIINEWIIDKSSRKDDVDSPAEIIEFAIKKFIELQNE